MQHDSNEPKYGAKAPPQADVPDAATFSEAIEKAPKNLKKWAAGIVVGCVCIVCSMQAYEHVKLAKEEAYLDAEAKAGPHIKTAKITRSSGLKVITVLGEAKPFASVTLYAKVSGYLKDVRVDKGDKVKKGQVIAIIESPETNTSLDGAEADAHNKKAIAQRMQSLYAQKLVSDQEYDQAMSDAKVTDARREGLAVQKGYQAVRAPFDGTVTARFADAGALVQNATNSQTSALPVATVSTIDKLRVYVYIDQRDASYVKVGQVVKVHLPERPEIEIDSTISRISGELDDKSRTLLTEVDLDNKDGKIVAGSFVQVAINIELPKSLQVPSEGVVMQNGKTNVAFVTAQNTLDFHEVEVTSNDGKFIQLRSGVEEGQLVALNVGNSIAQGSAVRPVLPKDPTLNATPPATSKKDEKVSANVDGKRDSSSLSGPEAQKQEMKR